MSVRPVPPLRILAGGAWSAAMLLVACSAPFEASPLDDGGSDGPGADAADAGVFDGAKVEDARKDGAAEDGHVSDGSSQCADGGLLGDPREESVADSVGMCAEAFLFKATAPACPTSFVVNLPTGAATGSPIRLGLYADDGTCSSPGALLAQAAWPGTTPAAPGWLHVPFAKVGGVTITQGSCYWIALASPAYVQILDRAGSTAGMPSCSQSTACLGTVPTPSWGGGCASTFTSEGPLSAYVQ
jgi:hypothetical protein